MRQLTINNRITNRETQSLEKYLQEIGKVELIDADAEVNLAKRIHTGDSVALERLVKANLRFVVSVAKQYQNHGLALGDLINEGNVGLIKAAMRFDETRGFKFISYAVWWIRQSILQALAEQARVVRLPLNRVGDLNRMYKAHAILEQRLQREPAPSEMAECLQVPVERIEMNLRITGRHVSFDAPFNEGEEGTLLDVLSCDITQPPDAELLLESIQLEIARALKTLSGREKEVICSYFGLNGREALTLDKIADNMQLTRERVRQIKENATNRLRATSRKQELKSYLE